MTPRLSDMSPERRARYQAVRRAAYERNKAKPEWVEAQREYYRDYDATKRDRDPVAKREYMRQYSQQRRVTDPVFVEKAREATRKSYVKHATERRAEQRARSQKPEAKEKAKLYAREWRKKNPSYARRAIWKRRGAKYIEDNGYAEVLLRDPCVYCGGPAGEIDHIVPIAAGGSSSWDNLAACCSFCNRSKGDRPLLIHLLRVKARAA